MHVRTWSCELERAVSHTHFLPTRSNGLIVLGLEVAHRLDEQRELVVILSESSNLKTRVCPCRKQQSAQDLNIRSVRNSIPVLAPVMMYGEDILELF